MAWSFGESQNNYRLRRDQYGGKEELIEGGLR